MVVHYCGVGSHCRLCGDKLGRTVDVLYYNPEYFLGKDEHIRICERCIRKMYDVIDATNRQADD